MYRFWLCCTFLNHVVDEEDSAKRILLLFVQFVSTGDSCLNWLANSYYVLEFSTGNNIVSYPAP